MRATGFLFFFFNTGSDGRFQEEFIAARLSFSGQLLYSFSGRYEPAVQPQYAPTFNSQTCEFDVANSARPRPSCKHTNVARASSISIRLLFHSDKKAAAPPSPSPSQ